MKREEKERLIKILDYKSLFDYLKVEAPIEKIVHDTDKEELYVFAKKELLKFAVAWPKGKCALTLVEHVAREVPRKPFKLIVPEDYVK